MGRDYVENRIREALRLTGGNEAKAKRQLLAWLYEDHKLLLELTQPHLNGIIAYALMRSKNEDAQVAPAIKAATQNKAKAQEADFGESMLRSFVSGNSARFGYEGSAAPVRRKTASQSHIDTMHMLAAASRKKGGLPPSDAD